MKTEQFKKIDIKTRQIVNTLFLGNYKAAFKWRGLEFDDFREYMYGDDVRHIDWLVSAREGKTVIRRYREEREIEILFILDSSLSMQFWESKTKRQMLEEMFYILGFSAIQNGDKIWAMILNGETEKYVPFKKWNHSLFQILRELEKVTSQLSTQELSFDFLNRTKIKNTLIFVISDKLELDEKSLKIAKLKNDIIYIHVSTDFENTLSGQGMHFFQNGKQELCIDLDDTKKRGQYIKMRQKKLEKMKRELLTKNIDSIFINETKNPYKEILALMKKREI